MSETVVTNERKRILERFRKLIAMQSSPNVNEASNAVARMKEFMMKYSIDIDELKLIQDKKEVVEEVEFDSGYNTPRKWMRYLATGIAEFFDCKNFMIKRYSRNSSFVFVGYSMDIEVCRETFDYLADVIRQNAIRATTDCEIHEKGEAINNFSMGAMHCIITRFKEEKAKAIEKNQSSTALVVVKDGEIKNYLSQNHPNIFQDSPPSFGITQDYINGFKFGKTVSLRKMKTIGGVEI